MKPQVSAQAFEQLQRLRAADKDFDAWAQGCGLLQHRPETQLRWQALLSDSSLPEPLPPAKKLWALLASADRIARMGMWLVAHMTYAQNVYLDGRALAAEDFKPNPEGHTGGALNMVSAYVGYLLANAISGRTRAWTMGQGHCVAAIDAVNVLVGNMLPAHAARYSLSDSGLTRLVRDFYSYAIQPDGHPESPLGSHVNVHTAGGTSEGGYLGFAGLQYAHMPLPGQSLVTFLSDGAFEEQRGSDWSARWWRAEDSGWVAPIMIANGRRIDQRTTVNQAGGVPWFEQHLRLNGFDPMVIDGRDPAAFAWAILEMEKRLQIATRHIAAEEQGYPVLLPYAIAETEKGWGFPGAGTNAAHNLPLSGNPAKDVAAQEVFNQGARALHIPPDALTDALACLNNHGAERSRERDHPLARLHVPEPRLPALPWHAAPLAASPMAGIDAAFSEIVRVNPGLRVRVGNPDEMRSNRMNHSLDLLKHRVTQPETGISEAVDGRVITVLNEEAVACAALGNKQGLNLIVSYEAFAVKMLGILRQEIIFARHQREVKHEPGWLSVPLLLTSHTWENGKNEQSHQDPSLAEALLTEMSDTARVLFPADWNSAIACLVHVYQRRGSIAPMIVPKREVPAQFNPEQAVQLAADGVLSLHHDRNPAVQLLAIGAYQLQECVRAGTRLRARGVPYSLTYIQEPGRLRQPRDPLEADYVHSSADIERLIPKAPARILVCHTHPEPLLGLLRPLDLGPESTRALGYRNRGGTLDVFGMQFANQCTWGHILAAAAAVSGHGSKAWLSEAEAAAVEGRGDPRQLDREPEN